MKTQQVILTASIIAMVDLSARRFVGFDGNLCAAGTKALGVVEAGTEAGGVAPANVNGIILVEAGAAICWCRSPGRCDRSRHPQSSWHQ
jgi:hypothetical protein